MDTYKVGYFVGSLAAGSINRKLAKALVRLAPKQLEMEEISFRDLPLYSYDYDADFPPPARAFKQALSDVDAVLFVTPEYNRSIPGGLKNAIDWASRPYGKNSFTRKPSAVIGTSPGAIGTAVAQQSLRSVLSFCNSPQMNAPEAYIQFKPGLITDDGEVTNEGTADFLKNYMAECRAPDDGRGAVALQSGPVVAVRQGRLGTRQIEVPLGGRNHGKNQLRTRKSRNLPVPIRSRHCYEAHGGVGDDDAIFSLNRDARAVDLLRCNQFLLESVMRQVRDVGRRRGLSVKRKCCR